jgi:tetratricopeptide (TPR) repeat protein
LLAFEDKKFKEAADQFRKTVLLQPDFEPAYYDLAGAQMNGDQARDALITLEKAKARFRENFAGEFFQGLAYSRLKEYTNALAHFTAAEVIARATETNRLTAPFYFQMGAAYERTQNYTEAESYFRKCLSLSPEFSEALNYLGYMWAERGLKLGEARELIEKAVQLEPKNAAYLDSLAWVLFKLEKPQEALDWMLKAIEQADEPDPTLFDHLGDIYAALQRPDQAREAWRKALAIEPNAEIQKKLGATVNSETARPPP